jgi:hypothetical protein
MNNKCKWNFVGLLTPSISSAFICSWIALLLPYGVLARELPLGLRVLEVLATLLGLSAYCWACRGAASTPVEN